jgi:signal transduction histidine kinase
VQSRPLSQRPLAWALGAGVTLTSLVTAGHSPLTPGVSGLYSNPTLAAVIGFCILNGVAAAFAPRWRWPVYLMAVASWLLLSIWASIVVGSYYAALTLRSRLRLGLYLIFFTTLIWVPFATPQMHAIIGWPRAFLFATVLTALTVGLPFLLGLLVKSWRQANDATQREQESRVQQAQLAERARIAREMHDVVAHRVALMVLHAGALELYGDDQHVTAEAALIGSTGRTALHELRDVLGLLRGSDTEAPIAPPDPPLPSQLALLAEEVRAAGVPVEMRVEGEPPPAERCEAHLKAERAVLRIAQEALTNVVKHAPGAHTLLTLRRSPEGLEVSVENDPPRAGAEASPIKFHGSGLGLLGLRERVSVLNGQLTTTHRPDGGFTVHAHLPWDPDAGQPTA